METPPSRTELEETLVADTRLPAVFVEEGRVQRQDVRDVQELGRVHLASFANSSRCRAMTFLVDVPTRR